MPNSNDPIDEIRRVLTQTIIGQPLADHVRDAPADRVFDVIIDPNLDYYGGRDGAKERIRQLILEAQPGLDPEAIRTDTAHPYVFAPLTGGAILALVRKDTEAGARANAEAAASPG